MTPDLGLFEEIIFDYSYKYSFKNSYNMSTNCMFCIIYLYRNLKEGNKMNEKVSGFSRISKHMRTWLTHSEIYGSKASLEEIINDIRSINMEEALTILAKFSVLDKESKKTLKNTLSRFVIDKDLFRAAEPFDLINLMYSVKWFIAYGSNDYIFYKKKFPKSFHVFLTLLKISDFMVENLDSSDDVQKQVLKSFLFNRPGELANALVRQHVMFEDIARDRNLFNGFEKEFIDIHSIFENEYGYTIKQYVSTLFALHRPCIQELNLRDAFTNINWGIDPENFFNDIKIREIAESITTELTVNVESLKTWATDSLSNPFDYEILLSKPFFSSNGRLIPFSPGLLNSTIFDGLCFKLNSSCRKVKKDFFGFFGRLFEHYVSRTLENAVQNSDKIPYKFIDEFTFGKENKRSSDAYLLLGRSLLIIECKGGRLRKETKISAEPKFSEEDYNKYAVDPIEQANTAYKEILQTEPGRFNNAKKVYVLSVSLQSFPKIPTYSQISADLKLNLHPDIKEIDYLGLSELELLAYIINSHDFTLFRFISNKKIHDDFIPYAHYYYDKFGRIKQTEYHSRVFNTCINGIKETLF
jgi:hypothetical protein